MDGNEKNIDTVADTENIQADVQSNETAQETSAPQKVKKYTDEDVDRIVAKKIAAERKRAAKALEIDNQESDLEIRERNIAKREMLMDVKERLEGDGLPAALANLISYESREDMDKSYKDVINVFNDCVAVGIKNAIRGTTPKTGSTSSDPFQKAFARK